MATHGCRRCRPSAAGAPASACLTPTPTAARSFGGNASMVASGGRLPPASVRQVPGLLARAPEANAGRHTGNGGRAWRALYFGMYSHVNAKLRWRGAKGHERERSAAKAQCESCTICTKRGRQSVALEEIRVMAAERGGDCLSNTLEGAARSLRWRCEHDHEWDAAPGNVKAGRWCPQCAYINRRHTIEEMKAIARENTGLAARQPAFAS
jgi:hypothetical protein